jgi:hypothetical protein
LLEAIESTLVVLVILAKPSSTSIPVRFIHGVMSEKCHAVSVQCPYGSLWICWYSSTIGSHALLGAGRGRRLNVTGSYGSSDHCSRSPSLSQLGRRWLLQLQCIGPSSQ